MQVRDTKGCRILEVAGQEYKRIVQGYSGMQETLGCRTGRYKTGCRIHQDAGLGNNRIVHGCNSLRLQDTEQGYIKIVRHTTMQEWIQQIAGKL
jgi:hypothetical protein